MKMKKTRDLDFKIKEVKNESKRYMENHHFSGHDFNHVLRVHKLCKKIAKKEKSDMAVLEAAALLHDLGREIERRDPNINHAKKSVEIAKKILNKINFPKEKRDQVLYAIRAHRFSKKIIPASLEAKILQDADRIDISGAIGIAMTFAFGGVHQKELYDFKDPFAKRRKINDEKYSLDHFYNKLLKLPEYMNTETGKKIIKNRTKFTKLFLQQFKKEILLTEL